MLGAVAGVALRLKNPLRESGYLPFGPFLASAGLAAMLVRPQAVLRWFGWA